MYAIRSYYVNKADTVHYLINLGFFAGVSYAMGYINFLIGQFFYKDEKFKRNNFV